MVTQSHNTWTTAGHGVPESMELDAETRALAALVNLPPGFAEIADDPTLGPAVFTGMARVEKMLRDAIANSDPFVDQTSRHLVEAGGKRVRPLLVLLSSLLSGNEVISDDVVKAAAMVELTHLATLYHDDVMDSAPLRRGAPTAHEVWGNSVAILTGDLIFARASILAASLGPAAVELQARTFERLCLGQLHESVGPRPEDNALEHYLSVISDKTASLLAAAGEFGARFGGSNDADTSVLNEYGEKVGVAFQLADDVIDVTGAKVKSGKTPGTDLRERVPTLPVLILRRMSADGDASASAVLELVDGDLTSDEQLAAAVDAVANHPATNEAWAVARQWADEARAALAPLADGPVKRSLLDFADAVVSREQ
ncbi:polyprenyl synthetase family protein [Neomicrococcus lactis]|uniref:polyprenyl synthetase family protein n=1 Tax=Neomicrococcus lactis TaxID=732241 RepID=UPI00161C901A